MYLHEFHTTEYYEFIGWSQNALEEPFTRNNIDYVIEEATKFYNEEISTWGVGAKFFLEELEETAKTLERWTRKYITHDGYLIIFGKFLGGSYVFKRVYE